MAAVLIILSRLYSIPPRNGILRSGPAADDSLDVPRDCGQEADPAASAAARSRDCNRATMLSGGLLQAAVATANAEAADDVEERREACLDDVITTPALLDICCVSVNWKLDRGVDRSVMSVWKLDRGDTDDCVPCPDPLPVRTVDSESLDPRFPADARTRRYVMLLMLDLDS